MKQIAKKNVFLKFRIDINYKKYMQKNKIIRNLIIAVLILTAGNVLNAQEEATFETITEALEDVYVNKHEVKKLIIWGEIAGSDYISEESEWKYFRILDEFFINLEEVTILTSQDIPDVDVEFKENGQTIKSQRSLFYAEGDGNTSAMWIKHFSAPNVKYIGSMAFGVCGIESVYFPSVVGVGAYAFAYCHHIKYIEDEDFASLVEMGSHMFYCSQGLISVRFPKVEFVSGQCFYRSYALTEIYFPEARIIGSMAFDMNNLVSIDLPKVTEFWNHAFGACYNLQSVSIATEFKEETEILFHGGVFGFMTEEMGENLTKNIDLTLGEYVIPKPTGNIWQKVAKNNPAHGENNVDYEWKSITIKYIGIIDEINDIPIYYLGNNMYKIENMEAVELYDVTGKLIKKYDVNLIDLNELNLTKSLYLFRIKTLKNKNYITKIFFN